MPEPARVVSSPPSPTPEHVSVLQIGTGWFPEAPGGLERVFHALATHLPTAGVEVRGLVTGTHEVAQETDGAIQSFATVDAALLRRLWTVRSTFRALLAERRPDLIASHFALYTYPILDLLPPDIPLVVHFHGPWALEGRVDSSWNPLTALKLRLERTVYQRGDRYIALSDAFGDLLCEQYGVSPSSVEVVPGGVDADRFDLEQSPLTLRHRLGWPTDRPIVLSVRRLTRRMGLENLVDALHTVRETVPDVLLMIAGKGPLSNELQVRIDGLGLSDHVRLLGFVPDDDLPAAYRAADVSIVPTVQLEGFGLITLESLASGTPVLVTPVGGLPEAVRSLSKDLVLAGSSTKDIARGLTDALTGDRPLPSAEACQTHVRTHHDWSVIAESVAALYRKVLAK